MAWSHPTTLTGACPSGTCSRRGPRARRGPGRSDRTRAVHRSSFSPGTGSRWLVCGDNGLVRALASRRALVGSRLCPAAGSPADLARRWHRSPGRPRAGKMASGSHLRLSFETGGRLVTEPGTLRRLTGTVEEGLSSKPHYSGVDVRAFEVGSGIDGDLPPAPEALDQR